jgi:hypothetical protein
MDGVSKFYTGVKAPITLAPIVANGILYLLDDRAISPPSSKSIFTLLTCDC